MKTLSGLFVSLLLAGGLFAQSRGGSAPYVTGGAGNVVFPAGTSANNPFITRVPSNVVYPGGGGPHFVVPGTTQRPPRSNGSGYSGYTYFYPVYVPYDSSYGSSDASAQQTNATPAQQAPPNVIVIYPPAQTAPAAPPVETAHPSMQVYNNEAAPAQSADETPAVDRYLLAFKDHSIYSVVAYWVDGDTLHYFTSGNTHNQASLSLVDRDLTQRLNKETGSGFKLPPAAK